MAVREVLQGSVLVVFNILNYALQEGKKCCFGSLGPGKEQFHTKLQTEVCQSVENVLGLWWVERQRQQKPPQLCEQTHNLSSSEVMILFTWHFLYPSKLLLTVWGPLNKKDIRML